MKRTDRVVLAATLAAALLLSGCRGGKTESSSSSGTGSMGSQSSSAAQTDAWRTGLGIVSEAQEQDRIGKLNTVVAAVLLDGDGKLVEVTLDELEISIAADGIGAVTMPTDQRTKRQKGDEYPLAEVSSLKKGWVEQVGTFEDHLTGKTPQEIEKLETDEDGKATDADILSGCTITVENYRQAVLKACENAKAIGAAKGDRIALGIQAENASSSGAATDDKDLTAQVDVSAVALTLDGQKRITSAAADMVEPAVTVGSDGKVTAPDSICSKVELGDEYGMRKASALQKEWYEHGEGFCSYLKGKNYAEVSGISPQDADLRSMCTISIDAMQKAALDAMKAN